MPAQNTDGARLVDRSLRVSKVTGYHISRLVPPKTARHLKQRETLKKIWNTKLRTTLS
jgi:hypothetical protein